MRINCHRTGHNRCSRLCVHVTDNQTRYRAPPLRGQNSLRPLKNYDAMSGVLGLRDAEADLDTAQETHRVIPARLPLGQVAPGQQVLDIQTKLITHAIRIAAFNTATTLARAVRVHTSYARANHEAHALIRQVLTSSGDID